MSGPASTLTKNIVAAMTGSNVPMAISTVVSIYGGTSSPLQATPRWFKVTESLGYKTFATAGLTNNVPIFYLGPKSIIHGIKIVPTAVFAGPSIATYTVSVGTTSNATQLASAFSMTSVGSGVFQLSSNFIEYDELYITTIIAQAVSTGANLNVATSGSVDIYAMLAVAA